MEGISPTGKAAKYRNPSSNFLSAALKCVDVVVLVGVGVSFELALLGISFRCCCCCSCCLGIANPCAVAVEGRSSFPVPVEDSKRTNSVVSAANHSSRSLAVDTLSEKRQLINTPLCHRRGPIYFLPLFFPPPPKPIRDANLKQRECNPLAMTNANSSSGIAATPYCSIFSDNVASFVICYAGNE